MHRMTYKMGFSVGKLLNLKLQQFVSAFLLCKSLPRSVLFKALVRTASKVFPNARLDYNDGSLHTSSNLKSEWGFTLSTQSTASMSLARTSEAELEVTPSFTDQHLGCVSFLALLLSSLSEVS